MPTARHILVVNSRSVHQPVFVVGAPHSGAGLIGRALKASAGFHVTIGQPVVLRTVYAFARRPSMYQGRTQAAASVIRDALAQGWQVTSHSCLECTRDCRAAAGLAADAVGPCVELRRVETFGDASPDLIYCAEALTSAFPDARIIQLVRDGRDAVASMLADPVVMAWYRPSFVNVDTEFPNPFFGIESAEERDLWPRLSPAGRCALRWRWSVRLAARLHHSLPSGQLKTIRYEHMLTKPDEALADLSRFTGAAVQAAEIRDEARAARLRSHNRRGPAYEASLGAEDITQVEKVAGEELHRLGYAS
jgi:sulfotransferase family protein